MAVRDWKLGTLFAEMPAIAASHMEKWPAHCKFFDDTVSMLQEVPLVHPTAPKELEALATARAAEAQRVQYLQPGSSAWSERLWPHGRPGTDSEMHLCCVYIASAAILRSLARSGFMAFCGLQSESIGAHRRTIEAIVHLELLVDRRDLAESYWQHACEAERAVRKANVFFKAVEKSRSQCSDPRYPKERLSPLQRALHDRGQDGGLNLGPHAGPQHVVLGAKFGEVDFFDWNSGIVGTCALRYPWETLQLCNTLRPKLGWIDGARWDSAFASLRLVAQAIESADRKRTGAHGPLPPWTSLDSLA